MPVAPGTTNRIVIDPPQPTAGDVQPIDPVAVESGSGHSLRLEYPKGLSPSEHADAKRRLARFPSELAQQLLDELAARLKAGTVRVSPFVHLAGLIKRANADKFVPEAALRIADERERRHRDAAYLRKVQVLNVEPRSEKTAAEDSPLAKRLADIRLRNRRQSKGD